MYQKFVDDYKFKENISSFITTMGIDIGMDKNDEKLKGIIRHYKKIDDVIIIFEELNKNIELIFKNNPEKRYSYMLELRNLISEKESEKEIPGYKDETVPFLPMEQEFQKEEIHSRIH